MSYSSDKGGILPQQDLPVVHVEDAVRKSALRRSHYALWSLWIYSVSDLRHAPGCPVRSHRLFISFWKVTTCQTLDRHRLLWLLSSAVYALLLNSACLPSDCTVISLHCWCSDEMLTKKMNLASHWLPDQGLCQAQLKWCNAVQGWTSAGGVFRMLSHDKYPCYSQWSDSFTLVFDILWNTEGPPAWRRQ